MKPSDGTSADAEGFEALAKRVLSEWGLEVVEAPNHEYDFAVKVGDHRVPAEVKFYRSERVDLELLERAAGRLATSRKKSVGLLVLSARISPQLADVFRTRFGVALVGGQQLASMAYAISIALGRQVLSALPYQLSAIDLTSPPDKQPFLDWLITPAVGAVAGPKKGPGAILCADLKGINCGIKDAKKYENKVLQILQYLFWNQLTEFRTQSRTTDGMSVMDIVARIKGSSELWKFLSQERSSRFVVFECKNYCGKIKQDQVLSTEKYLLVAANRGAGFILTRNPVSESAARMMEGALREHGKLLIGLSDEDLCAMLHIKDAGLDPSDYLLDRVDSFLVSLGR